MKTTTEFLREKTALIFMALCLTAQHYLGHGQDIMHLWEQHAAWRDIPVFATLYDFLAHNGNVRLHQLIYWSLSCGLFYLMLPLLFSWGVLKLRSAAAGLGGIKDASQLKPYLLLFVLMLPLLYLASCTQAFQHKYPFYNPGTFQIRPLLTWELFYALQFIGVEFFFRGFMLFTLEKMFGKLCIWVMILPYCMIHFGKPLPETIGSLVAGIVLGQLALKTRSIWPGAALHYAIGLCMDVLSLWQQGLI